ncbi:MAG: ABC transporter permease [Halodesulfurarchaeum sp.]
MSSAGRDRLGEVVGAIGRRLPGEYPFLSAIVAAEVVFLLLPSMIIFVASLQGGSTIQFPPSELSLQWYHQLSAESRFLEAFVRSVGVAVFATGLAIPVGIATALGSIRYDIRFREGISIYLLLPFTVPLVVSGVIFMLLFRELGILGQLWTVGLALTVINLPFMIWSVSSRVNALDPELEAAAMNLGAEELQTFLAVTLPSLLPGVITGALIMFVLSLNEFLVSLLIITPETITLPVLIYTSIRANISPLIAAVASVYVIVAIIAVFLADWLVGLEEFLRS